MFNRSVSTLPAFRLSTDRKMGGVVEVNAARDTREGLHGQVDLTEVVSTPPVLLPCCVSFVPVRGGTSRSGGIVSYQHVFSANVVGNVGGMVRDNSGGLSSNLLPTPIIAFERN